MKGLLLAGGTGSRLLPTTTVVNKHLLPIYDKPLVYYSLSTLMLAGVRDVRLVTTPRDVALFAALLGDGERLGMRLSYAVQSEPAGIADAIRAARDYAAGQRLAVALGDNVFYAQQLSQMLRRCVEAQTGATIFVSRVRDASQYGVATFDEHDALVALDEKPAHPASNWAVTGFYLYDERVAALADTLRPSARGELEVTDLNRAYLALGALRVERLGRGTAWLDTGTPDGLLQAANFIHVLEERQALKVACIEEIAWRMGFISLEQFGRLAHDEQKSTYGQYLRRLYEEAVR